MGFADWLLNNIGKATRWRSNTPDANGCAHDCEGGVDIPLPPGTPIYAIASGSLIGNGPWKGHGVITLNVPGTGKVYYQHLDVLPSFPQCANGNGCQGQVIQAGQLLGFSNADVGEVEIGINPAWGGIWGPPTDGSTWVGDPRAALIALASGGGNLNPQASIGSQQPCRPGPGGCPPNEQCVQLNKDGSVVGCLGFGCVCVSNDYAASHTPAGIFNPGNPGSILGGTLFPGWDVKRVLKVVGGVLMLAGALLIAFWPEATTAAKAAVL